MIIGVVVFIILSRSKNGDSFDTAIDISFEDPAYTYSYCKFDIGETKYFKFTAYETAVYTFDSTCDADVNAIIYDSKRVTYKSDTDYGDFDISIYIPEGETYYIAVDSSSDQQHQCTLTATKKQ